jgi:hypothetical protein
MTSATPHDFILTKGYNTVNRKPERKLKKEFSICTFHQALTGLSHQGGSDGRGI